MHEELDAVVDPHTPFHGSHARSRHQLEVNPRRVKAFVNPIIRFNPVTVSVARLRFLRAEAPIDKNLFRARRPEGFDSSDRSLPADSDEGGQ